MLNCETTSSEDLSASINSIQIYPNPTQNILNLNEINNIISPLNRVEIINKFGQITFGYIDNNKLDVSQLIPGMYILRVTSTKHQKVTLKFVKTN